MRVLAHLDEAKSQRTVLGGEGSPVGQASMADHRQLRMSIANVCAISVCTDMATGVDEHSM